jgi:hypothetical protein
MVKPPAAHDEQADSGEAEDSFTPRWWQRSPALGIAAALATGVAGIWLLGALGRPAGTAQSAFLYMATLPMALLLPALALFGALIAWRSYAASEGRWRLVLTLPAFAALAINSLVIGLFLRFLAQIFTG